MKLYKVITALHMPQLEEEGRRPGRDWGEHQVFSSLSLPYRCFKLEGSLFGFDLNDGPGRNVAADSEGAKARGSGDCCNCPRKRG